MGGRLVGGADGDQMLAADWISRRKEPLGAQAVSIARPHNLDQDICWVRARRRPNTLENASRDAEFIQNSCITNRQTTDSEATA